ncbi:MAG: hypothetical protein LBP76_08350 [Treponema sp.]|jgi:hypothetical protein|nr:hypothetical protein [Treponema sp.]
MKNSTFKRLFQPFTIGAYRKRFAPGPLVCLLSFMLFTACGFEEHTYTPDFPVLPDHWQEILGTPAWRLEWIDSGGAYKQVRCSTDNAPEIELPDSTAVPVLAFPYWPDRGIGPGVMRPAGAIFPFDTDGSSVALSWRGGIEATIYRELTRSFTSLDSEEESNQSYSKRRSQNFDWPRFRELLLEGDIDGEVQQDPWLADWPSICLKTVQSGFDKRRIKPRAAGELTIPLDTGPWIGTSPFAQPLVPENGAGLSVKAGDTVDTYFSAGGLFKVARGIWIFEAWE